MQALRDGLKWVPGPTFSLQTLQFCIIQPQDRGDSLFLLLEVKEAAPVVVFTNTSLKDLPGCGGAASQQLLLPPASFSCPLPAARGVPAVGITPGFGDLGMISKLAPEKANAANLLIKFL